VRIVGGIYDEVCLEPSRSQTVGSGLRAAVAVSRAATGLTLHSRASADQLKDAMSVAASTGFSLAATERAGSIAFSYVNPLATPSLDYYNRADVIEIRAEDDVVLAFGMIDARARISGRRIIVDPQYPGINDIAPYFDYPRDASLAIVGNEAEIRGLCPDGGLSLEDCATTVLQRYGADVVVVKRGAIGVLIITSDGVERVGSCPIPRVWPMGSGDVFSGVFALGWGQLDLSPLEAARAASRATAASCLDADQGPVQVVGADGSPLLSSAIQEKLGASPAVYLAGPFFTLPQRWVVTLLRNALARLGARVFSPFHDVGHGPPKAVALRDLGGIDEADAILALVDGCDPGTLFEVGYAVAHGKPVTTFGENIRDPDLTMLAGGDVELCDDLATAAYRCVWSAMR
jgi:hypothetical protein